MTARTFTLHETTGEYIRATHCTQSEYVPLNDFSDSTTPSSHWKNCKAAPPAPLRRDCHSSQPGILPLASPTWNLTPRNNWFTPQSKLKFKKASFCTLRLLSSCLSHPATQRRYTGGESGQVMQTQAPEPRTQW